MTAPDQLFDVTVQRMKAVAKRERRNAKRLQLWAGARATADDLARKREREEAEYGALQNVPL